MTSLFKIKIQGLDGKEQWVDASKVFTHLLKQYSKAELKGKKPIPYEDKVNNFFDKIDDEWKIALKKSYPSIDLEQEIISAKMWLLSNTHKSKSNFKAFLNNWLATAMRNGKSVQQEDSRSNYKKYVPPVINEEDVASPEEIREILRRNR